MSRQLKLSYALRCRVWNRRTSVRWLALLNALIVAVLCSTACTEPSQHAMPAMTEFPAQMDRFMPSPAVAFSRDAGQTVPVVSTDMTRPDVVDSNNDAQTPSAGHSTQMDSIRDTADAMPMANNEGSASAATDQHGVRVVRQGDHWVLMRNGTPYFVKGVGGHQVLDTLASIGGNSIRTWGVDDSTLTLLDEAHALGLTVTVGLWMGHKNHGFDYRDAQAVQAQTESYREIVTRLKDHPALLMWGIGNEVELGNDIPEVWHAIEAVAALVKSIDPNHPTMAVTADLGDAHEARLEQYAPSIDVWGINSYEGADSLSARLTDRGYDGPYVLTEYGPMGPWATAQTSWGRPLEPSAEDKFAAYARIASTVIPNDPARCIGGYAFIWSIPKRPMDTYYALFGWDGQPTSAVDALRTAFTGESPANQGVLARNIQLNRDDGEYAPRALIVAEFNALDAENDPLTFQWFWAPDHMEASIDWTSREQCTALAGNMAALRFAAPQRPGEYRLFGIARDPQGRIASASAPFRVTGTVDETERRALPLFVDHVFSPSGWMGDTTGLSRSDCTSPQGMCGGHCHAFSWTPAIENWVGVLWQYPTNNWGMQAGIGISQGASTLSFYAWTDEPMSDVRFVVGSEVDGFERSLDTVRLTMMPTHYEIDLTAVDYDEVVVGFGFILSDDGTRRHQQVYISDIVWHE